MTSRNRLLTILTLTVVLSLFLMACTRVLQPSASEEEASGYPAGEVTEPAGAEVPADEEPPDSEASEAPSEEPAPSTGSEVIVPVESGYPAPEGEEAYPAPAEPDDAYPGPAEAPATESDAPATEISPGGPPVTPGDDSPRDDTEGEGTGGGEGETGGEEGEAAAEGSTEEEAEPPAEESPTEEPATSEGGDIVHVVAPGQGLAQIATLYGTTWPVLAQYNGIVNPNTIYVGQEILIPGGGAAPAEGDASEDGGAEEAEGATYIVQEGDTLFSIAIASGVPYDQIAAANGITDPSSLVVGQELIIPGAAPEEDQAPAPVDEGPADDGATDQEPVSHTVQPGDTLLRLAVQYDITWQAIAEANDLTSPYVLYVGQTLIIPVQ